MPQTKEQQIFADFYETAGTAIKGYLIDVIDGPLVQEQLSIRYMEISICILMKISK